MGYYPSIVYEIDLSNNIARIYNPLFPIMEVAADLETIQDVKAAAAPGHSDSSPEELIKSWLTDEYKRKYHI